MSVLRSTVGRIIGMLAGYFGAAFRSSVVMGWYSVSDFEGGRGMAAMLAYRVLQTPPRGGALAVRLTIGSHHQGP